jgi:hypothetical protein
MRLLHRISILAMACLAAHGACAADVVSESRAAPFLMLVSIDGLKPEAVLDADRHGLKVPNLCSMAADGVSYDAADGRLPGQTWDRSSFFLVGPRVSAGRSRGEIDMRQIAPTLARIMGTSLKDAELQALPLP